RGPEAEGALGGERLGEGCDVGEGPVVGVLEPPWAAAGAVVGPVVAGDRGDADDCAVVAEVRTVDLGVLVELGSGVDEDAGPVVGGGELPGAVLDALRLVDDGAGPGLSDGEGFHVAYSWM